jgi:replicative DNA helicase
MSDPAPKIEEADVIAAEQILLGCVISNTRAAFDGAQAAGIAAHHFAHERHAGLWQVIAKTVDNGQQPASFALIAATRAELGSEVALYLAGLKTNLAMSTVKDAPILAKQVMDYAAARHALELVSVFSREIVEGRTDASSRIATLASNLTDVAPRVGGGFVSADAAAMKAIEEIERIQKGENVGVKTGITNLDRKIGGFRPGRFYLLGGRPSMGKTSAGIWIAWQAARDGVPVVFFSLEMTADELSARILSGLTRIDLERMQAGDVDQNELSRLMAARQDLAGLPLHIEDRPGLTVQEMAGAARAKLRGQKRALVIVDHLGLIDAPEVEARGLTEKTSRISNSLQRMAKALHHPVLALAQLNRASEGREDKRPQLSDLRNSGELEQDGSAIIFIHRENYYLERGEPKKLGNESASQFDQRLAQWHEARDVHRGTAELIIAKNRNGSIGIVDVAFDEATARVSNLSRGDL